MIVNSVISGGGQSSGKYQLLQRVKDDNNNEIGTVCGFQYDGDNNEYAIVCLDAAYRLDSGAILSSNSYISTLPKPNTVAVWDLTDTATFNCDKTLEYAESNSLTTIISTLRNGTSFTIDGNTYKMQVPNISEVVKIVQYRTKINNLDPTASQYPSTVIKDTTKYISSTQSSNNSGIYNWYIDNTGDVKPSGQKAIGMFIASILEIPNA